MHTDSENNNPNFKLPKDYFQSFGNQLQDHIELDKLLGGKRQPGFKVPDDYFDTLSRKLLQHQENSQKTPKLIALKNTKWLWTAINTAAIAILLVALNWNTPHKDSIESLDLAVIEDYLLIEDTFINDEDFETLLSDEDIAVLSDETSIADDFIIDYLENNEDSYNILIE